MYVMMTFVPRNQHVIQRQTALGVILALLLRMVINVDVATCALNNFVSNLYSTDNLIVKDRNVVRIKY